MSNKLLGNLQLIFGFITILFFFQSNTVTAQNISRDTSDYPYWIEMMQDPDANFFATVSAFEKYWENRKITKGCGWKPFKRWENFMRTRINPDGSKSAPDAVLKALRAKGRKIGTAESSNNDIWTEMGPTNVPTNGTGQPTGVGRINAIGFHPTDANTIYLGTPAGGLWKTTNNGNSWSSNTDNLPTLGVSSVLVHPTNTQILYIGTGDRDGGDSPGLGVFKSTDGGTTWVQMNNGMGNRTVGGLLFHPTNPNILIAATSGGVYKSTDGGGNWAQTQSGNFKDIRFKPTSTTIMYASASGSFYRSTNSGDTWTLLGTAEGIPDANRMVIGVSPANPNYVYVVATNSRSFKALYLSTDSGQNFITKSTTPNIMDYSINSTDFTRGQAWYDLCIAVDPLDIEVLYVGGVNVSKSIDGGATWDINAHWVGSGGVDEIHADQHVMEFSPLDGFLYNGNDGGFYTTIDNGTTWTDKSSGLAVAQVYKIGQSATVQDLIINGYQDNGTAIYDGSWRTEIGGDGMECIVDYTDPNYIYGALYYGDIRRSTNNGVSFNTIAEEDFSGITESGNWVTPYVLHETNPNIMYIGYRNIWRSTNVKGINPSWTKITNFTTVEMSVVEHSPANTNILYCVRDNGDLYRIDDIEAATPSAFVNLTANLPSSGLPTDLEAHPTNENIVYMTLNKKVYQSNDKGASWVNITGPTVLPNISINCIVYAKNTPDGLYVGTDAGVYYRETGDADWMEYLTGLPVNSEITELEIYYTGVNPTGDARIRAGTYGRGLWQAPLVNVGTGITAANFSANKIGCTNSTFTFQDKSTWFPTSHSWTFTPNNVTYVNGTSATSANPVVQFSATGFYTVSLTATDASGTTTETKTNYVEVFSSAALATENFESVATCSTSSDCGGTDCPLGLVWQNLPNGTEDNIDWRVYSGGTPSSGTGPSADHTSGSSSGKYLYLEASNGCNFSTATLLANCVSIPSGATSELSIWYHMFGGNIGSLHLDVNDGSGWNDDVVTPISGNQGDSWKEWLVDLSSYEGQSIHIRVRGITGNGYESDIAIDDISIESTVTTSPDLVCGNITANISVANGIQFSQYEITNQGTADSDPTQVYLYAENTATSVQQTLETINIPAILAGNTHANPFTVSPSTLASLADGSYTLSFDINPTQSILESDYGNNQCVVSGATVIKGCTQSDAHNYEATSNTAGNCSGTCMDEILNGDETGIDCGGLICADCTGGTNCLDDIVVNENPVAEIFYEAAVSITSSGTIPLNNFVEFRAGTEIVLMPNFTAALNSDFRAHLTVCTNQAFTGQNEETTVQETVMNKESESAMAARKASENVKVLKEELQMEIFPNPFNRVTNIKFYLPESGRARVAIQDIHGKEVFNADKPNLEMGWHEMTFQAENLPVGIYQVTLFSENGVVNKSVVIVK